MCETSLMRVVEGVENKSSASQSSSDLPANLPSAIVLASQSRSLHHFFSGPWTCYPNLPSSFLTNIPPALSPYRSSQFVILSHREGITEQVWSNNRWRIMSAEAPQASIFCLVHLLFVYFSFTPSNLIRCRLATDAD